MELKIGSSHLREAGYGSIPASSLHHPLFDRDAFCWAATLFRKLQPSHARHPERKSYQVHYLPAILDFQPDASTPVLYSWRGGKVVLVSHTNQLEHHVCRPTLSLEIKIGSPPWLHDARLSHNTC